MAEIKKIKVGETNYDLDALKLNGKTDSSNGNAAANTVVVRNANGTIQTEQLAISTGTTSKSIVQYNSTEDCIEFIFN